MREPTTPARAVRAVRSGGVISLVREPTSPLRVARAVSQP